MDYTVTTWPFFSGFKIAPEDLIIGYFSPVNFDVTGQTLVRANALANALRKCMSDQMNNTLTEHS